MIWLFAYLAILAVWTANVLASEKHNSTRSNKSYPKVIGYNNTLVSIGQANTIMERIDKLPKDNDNVNDVQKILKELEIKGIGKIFVEIKYDELTILLLKNKQDESGAQKGIQDDLKSYAKKR